MNLHVLNSCWRFICSSGRTVLIVCRSAARGMSLFLSGRPKTPLRVLCVMAFDALHMLRQRAPLPMVRLNTLAALLDCGACANAAFDNKDWRRREFRRTLVLLDRAGVRAIVSEYLRRLKDLERKRPSGAREDWQFQSVVHYRESVARLSLAILATTASGARTLDEAIRATQSDADLNFLFRIVMQCQIIDDVLDYREDAAAGLPGFLTGATPLGKAFEQTRLAVTGYADIQDLPRTGDHSLLRSVLALVSTCAKLVVVLGRFRERRELKSQCISTRRTGTMHSKFMTLRAIQTSGAHVSSVLPAALLRSKPAPTSMVRELPG
jgi:hypothetical protein